MADVKRQLTVAEAAQRLGVSYQTVLTHILKRRLPATKVGRIRIVQASDLAKFRHFKRGPRSGRKSI